MVTLSVLGILAAAAIPSFISIVNANRLASLSNDVMAMLQNARMEAVRLGRRVVICPSDDGAACTTGAQWNGWVAFMDVDADSEIDAADDTILRSEVLREPMQLWTSPSVSADSRIVYRHDGFAYAEGSNIPLGAAFSACIDTTRPEQNSRTVSLVAGSRVSIARTTDAPPCEAPANP